MTPVPPIAPDDESADSAKPWCGNGPETPSGRKRGTRYRKIDPRIWLDEKFRSLSDNAKFVFFMVLTHPSMTALGAMMGNAAGLAGVSGWTTKKMRKAIQECVERKLLVVNDEANFIAAPNFLKYNAPEGPNSVKYAWINALNSIPECQERDELIERCGRYLARTSARFQAEVGDAIWHALDMPSPMPSAIQEQEQEPEQVPEQEQAIVRPPMAGRSRKLPLSDDFVLTEAMSAALRNVGCFDPNAAFEQFRSYHLARQTRFADWDAAFRTWVGNHGHYGCPCEKGRAGRRDRGAENVSAVRQAAAELRAQRGAK